LAAATEQGESDRRAALHDLPLAYSNRALFNDRLEHGFQQAKNDTGGRWRCCLWISMDSKVLTIHMDTMQATAFCKRRERLTDSTRGEDTVCRHGGDEFLILITDLRAETDIPGIAGENCQRNSSNSAASRTPELHRQPSPLTQSVGILGSPERRGKLRTMLVTSADKCNAAKRNRSGISAFARAKGSARHLSMSLAIKEAL